MAHYIVDASVVIEYLIQGTYTPNATAFFNQMSTVDHLTVPEFCLLECTNVIWKQVRFHGMPRTEAENLLKALRLLKLRRAPMKQLLDHTLEIALNNQLAVYDSSYIALQLSAISIDQSQSRAAIVEGVALKPVTDFTL